MAGLLSLLSQVIAPESDTADINVLGRRQTEAPQEDIVPRPLGNRSVIEEAQDAAAKAPQRKGMFGIKGTLRDVLGTVGDAFLLQSGNKTVYAPQREREKSGDALAGFTQDPLGAIERLAYENPEQAQALYNEYMSNQAKQAQVQSVADNRTSMAADRSYKQKQDFGNYVARVLAQADTPDKQAAAMRLINTRAKGLGIDLAELGIADEMSEADRAVLGAGDMTVNQQAQIPLRQRGLDIQEQNAQSNRTRANRAPAPRQPRAQTELEFYKELSKKPASQRTQEENDFMKKFTRTGKSNRFRGGSVPEGLKTKSSSGGWGKLTVKK